MQSCNHCGYAIPAEARFCPECGSAAVPPESGYGAGYGTGAHSASADSSGYSNTYETTSGTSERTYKPDGAPADIGLGAITVFAYFGVTFFIPLVAAKESRFARYHANQGLVLFLSYAIYNLARRLLVSVFTWGAPFLGGLLNFVLTLGQLGFAALMVFGILHVCKGLERPLPVIGTIELIKL